MYGECPFFLFFFLHGLVSLVGFSLIDVSPVLRCNPALYSVELFDQSLWSVQENRAIKGERLREWQSASVPSDVLVRQLRHYFGTFRQGYF